MKPDLWIFRPATALRVEPTQTRPTDNREAVATVTWHASRALGNSAPASGRRFDTDAALMIQVSPREMTDVIAALCGWLPTVAFRYHGSDRNKSYGFERTDDGATRLELSSRSAGHFSFDLSASERMACLTLCFRQFQRSQGGIGSDTLFAMLRTVYLSTQTRGVSQ